MSRSRKITLPQNISLILPAYNEAKSIARTLDEAVSSFESRRYTYEIIVSADGDAGKAGRAVVGARD